MKAACFRGAEDIRVETVPDPKIINPRDIIVRVAVSGICGSDLHFYNGFVPGMMKGDIPGHEFCGEVVEVGSAVTNVARGDRVVVPSVISCGSCFFCRQQRWSLCDNSNPNAWLAEKVFGFAGAGIYGYTHLFGGYAGSDAEFVRVPFADVGAHKIPDDVSDEQALFASEALPTGMMAAEMCGIVPGDTVAVWGAGPIGQCAMLSAYLLGAERVIAIDRVRSRLHAAATHAHAETLHFEEVDVVSALSEMTSGRGPDACIDAVGLEAHGLGIEGIYDRAKQALRLESDRPNVLRQAIMACRKGGTISVVGVYSGLVDKLPLGAAMNKGLTLRMGQQDGHKYLPRVLEAMQNRTLDPTYLVTHRIPLERIDDGFGMFCDKADECMKVLVMPRAMS